LESETKLLSACQNATSYKPDLHGFLSQCELNYYLFQQLSFYEQLSDINVGAIWSACSRVIQLKFCVSENARYTTTLKMTIDASLLDKVKPVKLIVRLYHDAKMLEVMEGSGPAALKAVYIGANSNHKQVDEKSQLNRFVGECLRSVSKLESQPLAL
jgi:uncharacterized protein